ncbi:hypothetical protein STVIR_2779 [Streptomyces viridochromogenes Tue57]|uniref:Uncharacterized protein n=1 Tax=Streptomyces viridochromogenes Tue57 TaxID=1160705 RepID=L8PLN3_STRVR|nr:hypothetical protein STVIR_2779 [Streptomyces viridochromogenes Tue57]
MLRDDHAVVHVFAVTSRRVHGTRPGGEPAIRVAVGKPAGPRTRGTPQARQAHPTQRPKHHPKPRPEHHPKHHPNRPQPPADRIASGTGVS